MSDIPYIIDNPLIPAQDFGFLKDEGISLINALNQSTWTNMNPSDPGITILDQICFALTELGYCNEFPIRDILTDESGKLRMYDQFFTPDKILTSAPLIAQDYVKFLVDAIEDVKNASIYPMANKNSNVRGACFTYLLPDSMDLTETGQTCLGNEAYFNLSRSRNVGEMMIEPLVFLPVEFALEGIINLTPDASAKAVNDQIILAITNFIFPPIQQEDYHNLIADGYDAESIFSGPSLKNGWIRSNSIVDKKNTIRLTDILNLLRSMDNIKSMQNMEMHLWEGTGTIAGVDFDSNNQVLTVPRECLPVYVDDVVFTGTNGLVFMKNGQVVHFDDEVTNDLYENELVQLDVLQDVGATLDLLPEIPEGSYRDIENYYSIQNTFPEIYGIGSDANSVTASNFETAKSRQLKGYLMVYDQMLANQFSQLANVHNLFSFSNAIRADQKDYENLKQNQNLYREVKVSMPSPNDEYKMLHFQQEVTPFPSPYRDYLPTYFYQGLYNIPNVRPLLAGEDRYMFTVESKPDKVLEEDAWNSYKVDPYNKYMSGLREISETNELAEERRNRMLDHLLARHGEAAVGESLYNNNNEWSGSSKLNEVLTKSILLQNYHLFSYNRMKGQDVLAADPLKPYTRFKSEDTVTPIIPPITNEWPEQLLPEVMASPKEYFENFWLKTKELEKDQKLNEKDFSNFSAIELRMDLLLGVRQYYQKIVKLIYDFNNEDYMSVFKGLKLVPQGDYEVLKFDKTPILSVKSEQSNETGHELLDDAAKQLYWLSEELRGFIFLENQMLLRCAGFYFYLRVKKPDAKDYQLYVCNEQYSYDESMRFYDACMRLNGVAIKKHSDGDIVVHYLDNKYTFTKPIQTPDSMQVDEDYFRKVQPMVNEGTNDEDTYEIYGGACWSCLHGGMNPPARLLPIEHWLFSCKTEMFFPAYPSMYGQAEYKNIITDMANELVPAHITNDVYFLSYDELNDLIPVYIDWRNAMRFQARTVPPDWKPGDPDPTAESDCNQDFLTDTNAITAAHKLVEKLCKIYAIDETGW